MIEVDWLIFFSENDEDVVIDCVICLKLFEDYIG